MSRTLAEWLAYLEQLHPSAIDMGLERVAEAARHLGLGRVAPRIVTVTGTNGKGSTCAFLASLIAAQGLNVGVYSSPHLLRYNERVQINGRQASDEELCEAFAAVEAARGSISLTYFEMGTLAAFWLFQRAGLDAVVLEVGLGGRLDAVNIQDADVAVVTGIALDHAEWLGNSRESVAVEKAGIFRAGRPAVCGDLHPPAPLLERAAELGAPFYQRGLEFQLQVAVDGWSWRGLDAKGQALELAGLPLLDLPMENAAAALQAYALLDLPWDRRSIAGALANTRVTGRLDRRAIEVDGKPLTLMLDVGHNPQAAEFLAGRLAARPLQGARLAVFGLLADKDLQGVITPLRETFQSWSVAPLPTSRSREAAELQAALTRHGIDAPACASIAEALDLQVARARAGDEILVFGSFYCVAEALQWLDRHARSGVDHGLAG
jgi:dihydrofolate synthase/folylpolyglutamate synthase